MRKASILGAMLVIALLAMSGCASLQPLEHQYIMRGQVLDVTDGSAYICIGKSDGAQVGQELTVYKFVKSGYLTPKNQTPYFKKEITGKVKIENIVDEHYSHVKILSGSVHVNDVVELN